MKTIHTTGLGEPEPQGKRALFQPATEGEERKTAPLEAPGKNERTTRRRLRATIELPAHTLEIVQEIQNHHRLKTGRVLPLWKLVSQAIESYARFQDTADPAAGTPPQAAQGNVAQGVA